MEIKQDLTTCNYTPNGMKEVRGIVLHSMAGTYTGTKAWFKNPAANASAHYIISGKGEITQMVLDKDEAWHAGIFDEPVPNWVRPNPNLYCIGIELEDNNDPNWQYPQEERDAASFLVNMLMNKYGFFKDHVLLHKDLNPTRRHDPIGAFSLDWIFKAVTPTPPPAAQIEKLPKDSIIRDIYKALCGVPPSDGEVAWRLQEGLNIEELLNSIMGGDGRFQNKWILPRVEEKEVELQSAYNTIIRQNEQDWQMKLETAKNAKVEESLTLATPSQLFGTLIASLTSMMKNRG